MLTIFVYAIIIALVILGLVVYFSLIHKEKQVYNILKSQNIPGEPFVPIIGQLPKMREYSKADKSMEYHVDLQSKYGSVYLVSFGPVIRLVIIQPNLIADVLKKYTKFYVKPPLFRTVFMSIMGEHNLLVIEGDAHDRARKMLNPAFHFINLQSMVSIMIKQTALAVDKWGKTANTVDLQKELNSLTLSIIASSAFGQAFETNAKAKDVILNSAVSVLDAIYYRSADVPINQMPFLNKLPLFKKQVIDQGSKRIAEIVQQMVNERRMGTNQSLCNGNDLLDLLLTARDQDGKGFNEQEIKDEAMAFVLAGHETTGNLMVWCMYILMTHSDVYQDCCDEVDRVLKDQPLNNAQLNELHIIEAVLQETLRLYPPAPFIVRQCIYEHSIGSGENQIRLPVGATVLLNTYALHRSAQYWRDPLSFDYKRWMRNVDGVKPKLSHPFCYLPFSAGNRNCIGQNFAMLEAKVILAMLVQRLHFEIVPGQKIVPILRITMKTKYGLQAKITRRF
ncbi:unnamed protein product [Didymodactylos carnosus]|uniref:Cytochrome P450 n=1 Tax=Didymodactylos carnosus TaxID=1234261 RepID=A0A814FJI8_9BILA|nr:unnamed protein product [Didymodactylos carnosus]CAF1234717.1 unnamed protein product [Didymodactylos carnosus]CAF3756090.1 unnamed protein product [Didymodactylos carnosus]CAF4042806.1 unnamed protein product [Didymodactylos carnosus]